MHINLFFILIKKRAFGLPIRTQGRKEKTEKEKIMKNWKVEK